MWRSVMVLAVALIGIGAVWFGGVVQEADEEAVREVVELYFKGVDEHDQEALTRAFHPDAQLEASLGRYWERPFSEWRNFANRPAPADANQRTNEILSIDIEGLAAVAKTELMWPNVRYIDYLSLLKIDGEWRIVNKIWHQERR